MGLIKYTFITYHSWYTGRILFSSWNRWQCPWKRSR